ncbi:hypothetical protein [Guptibacillus algicola]|uniref:hypothetical protein n=1 Tax=Guptibacillus algicola TaxID=225844 RepID=UPI001CD3F615|nr:hypothetical protein [Alkalihalobacillus algicola]MCA0986778.1 hypothetical protein [Alkalihalobacillus algicola]
MEKKKSSIRMSEYTSRLLEARKKEVVNVDVVNEFRLRKENLLSSPTTATSTEETRLFMEYMTLHNLLNISKGDKEKGKLLTLKQFFKSKRNQQVEVYLKNRINEIAYLEAKVSAIGRDFVMLTNLTRRYWIPYTSIESANIPYGIPNYSNAHQHYLYDNNLRQKLLRNFGETVSKRDALRQQFYEETLQTNLNYWQSTGVEINLSDGNKTVGKILRSQDGLLVLKSLLNEMKIPIEEIQLLKSLRFYEGTMFYLKKAIRRKEYEGG